MVLDEKSLRSGPEAPYQPIRPGCLFLVSIMWIRHLIWWSVMPALVKNLLIWLLSSIDYREPVFGVMFCRPGLAFAFWSTALFGYGPRQASIWFVFVHRPPFIRTRPRDNAMSLMANGRRINGMEVYNIHSFNPSFWCLTEGSKNTRLSYQIIANLY